MWNHSKIKSQKTKIYSHYKYVMYASKYINDIVQNKKESLVSFHNIRRLKKFIILLAIVLRLKHNLIMNTDYKKLNMSMYSS